MSPSCSGQDSVSNSSLLTAIRAYWNDHIHDLSIATSPIGTSGFFCELDEYRFDKLDYLLDVFDSVTCRGKDLLEVGCGIGSDLVRFARAGAIVTGIDLAPVSVDLACKNFALQGLTADLRVMNGEAMQFPDGSFDIVYAHGVLQYTADARAMVREIYRVLRWDGEAILMVYNKHSWLNVLSKLTNVELEHQDAPVLNKYSIAEFKRLLKTFARIRIVPERFPVKTRLHHGLKAKLYNDVFVRMFHLLPKQLIRPVGWHLMAYAQKGRNAH